MELDLAYATYNANNIIGEYYSLVDSALRITLQINSDILNRIKSHKANH